MHDVPLVSFVLFLLLVYLFIGFFFLVFVSFISHRQLLVVDHDGCLQYVSRISHTKNKTSIHRPFMHPRISTKMSTFCEHEQTQSPRARAVHRFHKTQDNPDYLETAHIMSKKSATEYICTYLLYEQSISLGFILSSSPQ
jgi:hypothetical protein